MALMYSSACCVLSAVWDYQFALMLVCPLKRDLSLQSILFWSSLCASDKEFISFPACSLSCPSHSDSAVTQACIEIQLSSRMQGLLWTMLRWLSFENTWEFCAAEQGEILIKIPSVTWEDSRWSLEQSGKYFLISNRLNWISAFWLFQFISDVLFTEVL